MVSGVRDVLAGTDGGEAAGTVGGEVPVRVGDLVDTVMSTAGQVVASFGVG